MTEAAQNQVEYFLGVDGEQKGPFSWDQVFEMLQNQEVSQDTPIWSAGMADWQVIGSLDAFKGPPEKQSAQTVMEPRATVKPQELPVSPVRAVLNPSQESSSSDDFEPIFSQEIHFAPPGGASSRVKLYVGIAIAFALGGGFYLWNSFINQIPQASDGTANLDASSGRNKKAQPRKIELSALMTGFHQKPEESIPKLIEFIKANPKDNESLEALTIILSFYKQKQMNNEAGELLLISQRPKEALEFYLKEPPNYQGLDKSYEMAVTMAAGEEKKSLLLKQIDLEINKLNKLDEALVKIKQLEKEFPGVQHPYLFYFKSVDEKIADLFSRVSFNFSESLNTFIRNELGSITFEKKPIVQILKEKSGSYRISAVYKGNIDLRNDRIPNVFFVFWFWNDQWVIVDTNLTKERSKFAKEDQKRHTSEMYSAPTLLAYLENLFRSNFPGKSLHDSVSVSKPVPTESVE